MFPRMRRSRLLPALGAAAVVLAGMTTTGSALAAAAAGCEGGGFTLLGVSGAQVSTTVPASSLGTSFRVQGRYVQFDVDAATFGVRNYAFTGAPNPLDMTGQTFTPVFESKLPDHRGLTLTGDVSIDLLGEDLVITRDGPGLSMKIQALDCAKGGIFQQEPARVDGTSTRFTVTLASNAGQLTPFYFDNRNFRDREGDALPFRATTIIVKARINFGNDFSSRFVGVDSPQPPASAIAEPGCVNQIATRFGVPATVKHCGGVARFDIASGGRLGTVFGDDAVEVGPPVSVCVHNCQARNQVRGAATVLGFPFPVNAADRLQPRFPASP